MKTPLGNRLALMLRPILVVVALLAPLGARAETPPSEPKAVAIADRVMKALGGKERWDKLTGIRWGFGASADDTVRSERRHSWNKHTGWHRVSGKNRMGESYCIMESLNDSTGMAWVNGNKIEGDSLQKLLGFARRVWTNDTYWFLMPYKLRDPGVMLSYLGPDSSGVYERLGLTFDHVGQTPGDRYTVFVNRKNNRVEKWEFQLEGSVPPPEASTWEGWEEHGGLWFATAHRMSERTVFTRGVEAVTAFRPDEFTAP